MYKIIFSILLLKTIVPSHARVLEEKWWDKFAFPSHLVGTNYSSTDGLTTSEEKYHPVDLAVDNSDDEAYLPFRQALANVTTSHDPTVNQYTQKNGLPRLRNAIAKIYSPLINHQLNPDDEVLVTVGGTEALYLTIFGHTSTGDEWLVIEPAYTVYLPIIRQARGDAKLFSLTLKKQDGHNASADDWQLNKSEFEKLLSPKTKGIVLNNPQNPIGKVWSLDELQFIGSMAEKYNLLIISDEAHEWITFKPHIRIASLTGLYKRTITIGSASKTFSLAGWRIGWAYGPNYLLSNAKAVHIRAVSSVAVPQQHAIAYAFEEEIRDPRNGFLVEHRRRTQDQRDVLTEAFNVAGLKTARVDAGFCVYVDWSPLKIKQPKLEKALDFAVWMIENVGVMGLPGTIYYGDEHEHLGDNYARFCYQKKNETLKEAARRLKTLKQYLI